MYRILILITVISFIYVLFLYLRNNKEGLSDWKNYFHLMGLIDKCSRINSKSEQTSENYNLYDWIFCGSFFFTILSFIILAVSGFLPVLVTGQQLGGILLIIHVTIAPVFILSITISVLLMVHNMRFNYQDWETFNNRSVKTWDDAKTILFSKINFWIAFIMVLSAILAIILMMFPFFGTYGQEQLLGIHRYSTLILFLLFQHQIYIIAKKQN